jgi:2'-5' RNA ligase
MTRLRTFVGVDITPVIRERAVALQQNLSKTGAQVKWVEPENLHVTLLFLGEVEDREVPNVCRAISEETQKHSSFPMTVETVGCFPNPRRPRILWIGVGQGAQELCSLHDALEAPLLNLGCYRREERKYTPHITIGRVRGDRPANDLSVALAKQASWHGGQSDVREILVLSSELTPQGPVYTIMSRAKLA